MSEATDRLRYLVNQYANQTASLQEEKELFDLIDDEQNEQQFKSLIMDMMANETVADLDKQKWEPILQKVLNSENENVYERPLHRKTISRFTKWIAAAVIIGIVITAAWFVFFNKNDQKPIPATLASQDQRFKNDVSPGTNKPQLVLADGRTVTLDSAALGNLATEGNVKVTRNENGEVAYNTTSKPLEVKYNTGQPALSVKTVNYF